MHANAIKAGVDDEIGLLRPRPFSPARQGSCSIPHIDWYPCSFVAGPLPLQGCLERPDIGGTDDLGKDNLYTLLCAPRPGVNGAPLHREERRPHWISGSCSEIACPLPRRSRSWIR